MSRDIDRAQDLYAEILGAMCRDTGLREELAKPFADSAFAWLQANHGGQKLYVPAPERKHDVSRILADLSRGKSQRQVCKDYGIGLKRLRRLIRQAGAFQLGKKEHTFF